MNVYPHRDSNAGFYLRRVAAFMRQRGGRSVWVSVGLHTAFQGVIVKDYALRRVILRYISTIAVMMTAYIAQFTMKRVRINPAGYCI